MTVSVIRTRRTSGRYYQDKRSYHPQVTLTLDLFIMDGVNALARTNKTSFSAEARRLLADGLSREKAKEKAA